MAIVEVQNLENANLYNNLIRLFTCNSFSFTNKLYISKY